MSIKWISRILLMMGAVSLLVLVVARLFLGGWMSLLWWPLGTFLISVLASVILDFRTYWSLLTLKTAKDGLGLGVTFLIAIAISGSLAYLTARFDKTFDLTEEKLHSLSAQTLSVLNSMKDVQMTIFYKGKKSLPVKNNLERYFKMYKQNASHIKFEYVDAFLNNKKAKSYLESLSDKSHKDLFLFVEYQGKRVRVEDPVHQENNILSALIQVSRRVRQNIYLTSGHGERDLFSEDAQGLSLLKSALEGASFDVSEWDFIEKRSGVPENTSLLMILGPTKPFFEKEIEWIKEYVQNDGRVLVALDPGVNQNLAPFLKETFGVEFKNNFIVSPVSALVGKSKTSVMGIDYNANHLITKDFVRVGGFTSIFDEVSQIAFEELPKMKTVPLIHSIGGFALSSLDISPLQEKQQSFVIAVAVEEEGVNAKENQENKNENKDSNQDQKSDQETKDRFMAVVFGDSDFLTNNSLNMGFHRDIALNTVSYLADREGLLNIRPKQAKGTRLVLTQSHKIMLILVAILLPLICFICAVFMWVRRAWA